MPVDNPELLQAGALEDIIHDARRTSVSKGVPINTAEVPDDCRQPTEEELHGPNALRRVAAPIPLAAYTVAFVELCERFSYYGSQIVCK